LIFFKQDKGVWMHLSEVIQKRGESVEHGYDRCVGVTSG